MSTYPDDPATTGREPTRPLGWDDDPPAPRHDDPVPVQRDPGHRDPAVDPDRRRDDARRDHDDRRDHDGPSALDEAVEQLQEPDNQARLLLAMAVVLLLTFAVSLGLLIDRLADGPGEPVLIDGVPCLVQEGEDDNAVLFCQR